MNWDEFDSMPAWVVVTAILLTIAGAAVGQRHNRSGVGVLLGAMLGPAFFVCAVLWLWSAADGDF